MCFFFLVNLFKFQLGSAFFFNITFYLIYEHRKKKKKTNRSKYETSPVDFLHYSFVLKVFRNVIFLKYEWDIFSLFCR